MKSHHRDASVDLTHSANPGRTRFRLFSQQRLHKFRGRPILKSNFFLLPNFASGKPNFSKSRITNAVQNATKCTEVHRLMFCRDPHRWAPIQQKVTERRSTGQDINIYIISNTNKNINTMRAYGRRQASRWTRKR